MTPSQIRDLLDDIEHLMYGFNYEVTLGFYMYEGCSTLKQVNKAIKENHASSNPEEITPVQVSEAAFWEMLNETFDYRGDRNSGFFLELEESKEALLRTKQQEYKDFLSHLIAGDTQIYQYPYLEGVAGYPVFWEYAFVLLTKENRGVLVCGSSSD